MNASVGTRRSARIVMAALVAMMLGASPAWAYGSFNYTADFERLLYSRSFESSGRGFVFVDLTCQSQVSQSYTVTLQRRTLGVWYDVGSKGQTCELYKTDQAAWEYRATGHTLRIKFSKRDGGFHVKGYGSIAY